MLKLFLPVRKRRGIKLYDRGSVYHLRELYDEVNKEYFNSELKLKITWFGNALKLPKRRMTLGSFTSELKLIKIHRFLDQEQIPKTYVKFIIYHEMLHYVAPPVVKKWARRKIHHAHFLALEKQFKEYENVQKLKQTIRSQIFK